MTKKPPLPKITRVFDLVPSKDHASKPSELIQIREHAVLSLTARRAVTVLWHNAHRQGIAPGKLYSIPLSDLVSSRHKGTESIDETIVALMRTIVEMRLPNGGTRRAQVLGGNDMDDPERPAGTLRYRLDETLIGILETSTIWGRISLPELMALSSKYAVSLYEHVSQWMGLKHKSNQLMSLEDFRDILGIEPSKYVVFGEFNREILKKIIPELNALAPFNITCEPVRTGKKITHLHLTWWPKSSEETKEARAELGRSRVGRRARISQKAELIGELKK